MLVERDKGDIIMENVSNSAKGVLFVGGDIGYGIMKSKIYQPSSHKTLQFHMQSVVGDAMPRKLKKWSELQMKNQGGVNDNFLQDQLDTMDVEIADAHHKEDPEHYFLGKLATIESKEYKYVWDDNKSNSRESIALLLSQIAAAQVALTHNEVDHTVAFVYLATGLPIRYFSDYLEDYELNLRGTHTVKFLSGPYEGKQVEINIIRTKCYAQGWGVWFDQLYLDNLEPNMENIVVYMNGYTLVVDVGHRTLDYALFYEDDMLDGYSGSLMNYGMDYINDRVKTALEKHGISVSEKEIDATFLYHDGLLYISDGDKTLNLKPHREKYLAELAEGIQSELYSKLETHFGKIARSLVGGGTGKALEKYLHLPNQILVPDAQFANASGFLKAARLKLAKEKND